MVRWVIVRDKGLVRWVIVRDKGLVRAVHHGNGRWGLIRTVHHNKKKEGVDQDYPRAARKRWRDDERFTHACCVSVPLLHTWRECCPSSCWPTTECPPPASRD